jgi:hypothetical protein
MQVAISKLCKNFFAVSQKSEKCTLFVLWSAHKSLAFHQLFLLFEEKKNYSRKATFGVILGYICPFATFCPFERA